MAANRATPLSDLDLALWLDPSLTRAERWELHLHLLRQLTLILGHETIDLAILNDIEPVARYNLLKGGKRFFCSDEATTIQLQVWATKLYFDFLPTLRLHQAALRERIKTGRFAHGG